MSVMRLRETRRAAPQTVAGRMTFKIVHVRETDENARKVSAIHGHIVSTCQTFGRHKTIESRRACFCRNMCIFINKHKVGQVSVIGCRRKEIAQ